MSSPVVSSAPRSCALGGIQQVAAGAVRRRAVGRVAERQEQPAGVAAQPVHRERRVARGQRQLDDADAPERERVLAAVRQRQGRQARIRRRDRLERDDEAPCRVVRVVAGPEAGTVGGRDRRLRVLAEQPLPDRAPVRSARSPGRSAAIARTSTYSSATRRRQSARVSRSAAEPSPDVQSEAAARHFAAGTARSVQDEQPDHDDEQRPQLAPADRRQVQPRVCSAKNHRPTTMRTMPEHDSRPATALVTGRWLPALGRPRRGRRSRSRSRGRWCGRRLHRRSPARRRGVGWSRARRGCIHGLAASRGRVIARFVGEWKARRRVGHRAVPRRGAWRGLTILAGSA